MTVHLPLASSAGWFEGRDILVSLALRLKTLLLLEEELIVSPGGFLAHVTAGELSEQHFSEANIPWPRDDPSRIGFDDAVAAIELRMDWLPLLTSAGVTKQEGIRFAPSRLTPATKRELKARIDELLQSADIVATLAGAPAIRAAIVKHWLIDAADAALDGAALSVDPRASPFVGALHRVIDASTSTAPPRGVVLRLHDVSAWEWEGALRFRSSTSGAKLRALFRRARPGISPAELAQLQSEADALIGRDPQGPRIDVAVTPNRVPALLGNEIVGEPPCVYAIGRAST